MLSSLRCLRRFNAFIASIPSPPLRYPHRFQYLQ
jgi:hypothetical protein